MLTMSLQRAVKRSDGQDEDKRKDSSGLKGAYLWRPLLEEKLKLSSALSAWIEPRHQMEVVVESVTLIC